MGKGGRILGECDADCDVDTECEPGLLCADAHMPELDVLGWDISKAYCGNHAGKWNEEVCYDPEKLSYYICGDQIQTGGSCEDNKMICFNGDPICCRTHLFDDTNGNKICSNRQCHFTYECKCDGNTWSCTDNNVSNCVDDALCFN